MSDIFLFEGFRFDRSGTGLCRRDAHGDFVPVAIGSRALDILGVLLERPGELVSRDEIMTAVWPRTVVEDSNLTVHISALRRVLDQGRSQGSCIQTVAARGYRFVSGVTRQAKSASGAFPRRRNRYEGETKVIPADDFVPDSQASPTVVVDQRCGDGDRVVRARCVPDRRVVARRGYGRSVVCRPALCEPLE
jgi:DNA-binding winged helix-turn-helix (wHTH) protein